MRITDEVFMVGGSRLTAPEDAAAYLVAFDGRAALIDCGCGRGLERLMANVADAGVTPDQIDLLLLTHCHFDHTGGAKALRDQLQCRVAAHELEAAYIENGDNAVTAASWYGSRLSPCTIDLKLSGPSEDIPLGKRAVQAIHIPGHSPVVVSEGQKVVFAQDVHGPLHPGLLSDAGDYAESLQKLIDLKADILCEGHFGVYRGEPEITDFIRQFL